MNEHPMNKISDEWMYRNEWTSNEKNIRWMNVQKWMNGLDNANQMK